MNTQNGIDRRQFLMGMASAGTLSLPIAAARAQGSQVFPWPDYQFTMNIDLLATPGPSNTPDTMTKPLTVDMVENAAASGITCINLTVNGGTVEETFRNIAYWERELNAHPDQLCRVRSIADLDAAKRNRQLGIIYGFQDTKLLNNDLSLAEDFSSYGVRVMQLTYNLRSLAGDGCLEQGNAGLSRFGLELLERLNSLRILVDLSHAGQQTMSDAIEHSKAPVTISHSGCKALAGLPRNVSDEQLKLMSDRGGVIGIYLMPFLTNGTVPTTLDVIQHIEHAVNVCGEDHVGIGSDLSITPIDLTDEYRQAHRRFVERRVARGTAAPGEDPDIYFYVPELNSPLRLAMLAERLAGRGHSASRIEKIIGGNFYRLLKEVW